jgi:beta-glucosidase
MPGPKARRVQAVVEAVRAGELDVAVLNESVRRILKVVFKTAETPKGGGFDTAAHHALARRIAGEGMVLLKNDGLLPLQAPGHIAVIGRSAKQAHFQGGGSSHINPTHVDVPFAELQKQAGSAELSYCDGYPAGEDFDQSLIDEAVVAAGQADVALLFISLPGFKESEGYDRADLDVTLQQTALIKAVSAAQPNTVVILNNGSAVAMSEWFEGPAAVLEAWMMGQAGGGAIADVLFGRVNPSGKLAETFPFRISDTPAHINYPGGNGAVQYGESLFIGYRYYDAKGIPVQFPFGYGLSYTTFAYDNIKVSSDSFKDRDGLTVSVDITNTGNAAGREVVQVYVHDQHAKLVRPKKELKGFAKVGLKPGETKTVTIGLDFRAFAYWHPGYKQWITESGKFDILVGASSADIRLTRTVTLESTLSLPSLLNSESTVREWADDPRGWPVVKPVFEKMMAQMGAMFGQEDNTEHNGMEMMAFMMEMPLLSLLHFQESMLDKYPDELVDVLLREVHASR